MDHADHVALIRGGVDGAGPRWLELGAGEGAFTLALADVLGADGEVVALDRDRRGLEAARERVAAAFPATALRVEVGDFTHALPPGPFGGVLAANSLHFVRDRQAVLAAIRLVLAPGGRLVVEIGHNRKALEKAFPHLPFRWPKVAAGSGFVFVLQRESLP